MTGPKDSFRGNGVAIKECECNSVENGLYKGGRLERMSKLRYE